MNQISPRSLVLGAVVALAIVAAPATASAATYCVSDSCCVANGGVDDGADVQKALDDAKASPGLDQVQLGAGTFSAGPYAYTGTSATNGVEIDGAGAGATHLAAPADADVLTVDGDVSKVSSLGLAATGGNAFGLVLTGASQATDLAVTSDWIGVRLAGGASLTASQVTTPVHNPGINVAVQVVGHPGASTLVADNVLSGQRAVENGNTGGSLTIRRVRASGQQTLMLHCGEVTVEDSVIDTDPLNGSQGVTSSATSSCGTAVTVRHSTIVGHGRPTSSGAYAATSAAPVSIALHDSIVSGFGHDLRRLTLAGGPSTITTDYSAYNPANALESGAGSIVATNALTGAPGFVDPAGDYRLRDDSPLIDAGDPAGLAAGEPNTDLAGNARIVDALGSGTPRSDRGAFEHDAIPQSTPPGGPAEPPSSGPETTEAAAAPSGDAGQHAVVGAVDPVAYTQLRAHETCPELVWRRVLYY
jgi:hypothetical protein